MTDIDYPLLRAYNLLKGSEPGWMLEEARKDGAPADVIYPSRAAWIAMEPNPGDPGDAERYFPAPEGADRLWVRHHPDTMAPESVERIEHYLALFAADGAPADVPDPDPDPDAAAADG